MDHETETGIKEEFTGEAFGKQILGTLSEIAESIREEFKENDICVGVFRDPFGLTIYEYPCIYTERTVIKERLWIFRKEAIAKDIILKVGGDGYQMHIFVYDERVLKTAREAFEKLKESKDEFKDYAFVIKKDFKTDS